MEHSSFTSSIEQFQIFEAFTRLEGEFNFLKPQFFFQPYTDLQSEQGTDQSEKLGGDLNYGINLKSWGETFK